MASKTVLDRIEEWRSKLLDLTKRNPLINCKYGARGALELSHPSAEGLWDCLAVRDSSLQFVWKHTLVPDKEDRVEPKTFQLVADLDDIDESTTNRPDLRRIPVAACLDSPLLKPNHVLTELTDAKLSSRLRTLELNGRTSIEEQGVNILYVAVGLLEWYEAPQSDEPLFAPLLLLPVSLSRPGPDELWSLTAPENEVVENQCLREMLKLSFKFELPKYAVEEETEKVADAFEYFRHIEGVLAERQAAKRWRVLPKVLLSTFSFQKIAMWEDLGKNASRIAAHSICRSIAGDHCDGAFGAGNLMPAAEFDDKISPTEIHSVLDSDSTQMKAVVAAKGGISLVVDGPPGTGKSQTIANIIAECLADNKTVLFVSEKTAALEVVKRRLDQQQLGDFCLECHSHKANKKEVLAELARCLKLPDERYRDQTSELRQLQDIRSGLNAYVRALHRRQTAFDSSAFQIHGRLAKLKNSAQTRASVRDIKTATEEQLRQICRLLKELGKREVFLTKCAVHPWRGALPANFSLTLKDDVRQMIAGLVAAINYLRPPAQVLVKRSLFDAEGRVTELGQAIQRVRELLSAPVFPALWFRDNPRALVQAIESLHAAEESVKQYRQRVPQFRPDATRPNESSLQQIWKHHENEFQRGLQVVKNRTLCGLASQIQAVTQELSQIRLKVARLKDSIVPLARQLQIRIDGGATFTAVRKLSLIGATISDSNALKPDWFDSSKRAELAQLQLVCDEQFQACNSIRTKFTHRWTNDAFRPIGESVAKSAIDYETFLQRVVAFFNGRWSAYQRELRQIYQEPPPRYPSVMLEEMAQLRTFHRHWREVTEAENQHRQSLVFTAAGKADWEAVRRGCEAVERLQGVTRIPDKLKQLLCTEAAIDRGLLRGAAEAVATQFAELERLIDVLNNKYTLSRIGESAATWTDLSLDGFTDWVSLAETSLKQLQAAVNDVISELAPGADLSLADLPQAVAQLEAADRQNKIVSELREQLKGVPGACGTLAGPTGLHPADLQSATALREFLDRYGDSPAPLLVTIVTDLVVRAEIERAVRELVAAFRQKLQPAWNSLVELFPTKESISSGVVIDYLSFDGMSKWLRYLEDNIELLQEWIEFRQLQGQLESIGLGSLANEVLSGQLNAPNAHDAFLGRFYRQWLDAAYAMDPALRAFRPAEHENLLETFRALDRDWIDGSFKRIRAKLLQLPDRPHAGLLHAPATSETGVLLRESARKRPRMPLRQFFRKIPKVLQRLKPCLMMSPLAVSTFLDSPDIGFDVVIFDEASQVRPYDAIGAIYRGKQLLVAGDQKQLPPTNFFDRMDSEGEDSAGEDDEEEAASIAEFESILDVCCSLGMPRERLCWHYRSRRESLIAFSNRFFYENELITFPSIHDMEGHSAVLFHYLPDGQWAGGNAGGINAVEAKATAELVLKHLQDRPEESLGVITFNQRQQMAVLDEIDNLRRRRPELAELLSNSRREPFFVKNLENVQGDERDHILLSITYGPDAQGNVAMRFGPLNKKGGERRLNVAVTRAPRRNDGDQLITR